MSDYLAHRTDTDSLFNRLTVLWAATKLPGVLTPAQRQAIVDAAVRRQENDGGWSTSALGSWKPADATALDTASDGYATGLITVTLQQSGASGTGASVSKGLSWLVRHQDAATGMWVASSLNKQRDAGSDAGKFMSDAATAYAVLALTSLTISPTPVGASKEDLKGAAAGRRGPAGASADHSAPPPAASPAAVRPRPAR